MDTDGLNPCIRFQCPFCIELLTAHAMAEHRKATNSCPAPLYSENRVICCFTCGSPDCELFSHAQQKGSSARCSACVAQGLTIRHRPPTKYPSLQWEAGKQLMDFVSAIDVEGGKELLHRHGADIANHKRQLQLGFSLGYAWDEHGMSWPETDQYQPISPLRMVAFRLSDCCLSLEDLGKFELIARLLIDAGADAVDAAAYLQRRYGSTSGS